MSGNRTSTPHVITPTSLITEHPASFEEFSDAIIRAAGRLGPVTHHDTEGTLLNGFSAAMQTEAVKMGSNNVIISLTNGATPVATADRLEIEGLIGNHPDKLFGFGPLLMSTEDRAGTLAWLNRLAGNPQVFVIPGLCDNIDPMMIEMTVMDEVEAFLARLNKQTSQRPAPSGLLGDRMMMS